MMMTMEASGGSTTDDGSGISQGLRLDSVCGIPDSFVATQRTFSVEDAPIAENSNGGVRSIRRWLLLWLQLMVGFCVGVIVPVVLITAAVRRAPHEETASITATSPEYPDTIPTSVSTDLVNSSVPMSTSSTELDLDETLPSTPTAVPTPMSAPLVVYVTDSGITAVATTWRTIGPELMHVVLSNIDMDTFEELDYITISGFPRGAVVVYQDTKGNVITTTVGERSFRVHLVGDGESLWHGALQSLSFRSRPTTWKRRFSLQVAAGRNDSTGAAPSDTPTHSIVVMVSVDVVPAADGNGRFL